MLTNSHDESYDFKLALKLPVLLLFQNKRIIALLFKQHFSKSECGIHPNHD